MKKSIIALCAVFMAVCCSQPGPEPFQTGDLVFVGLPPESTSGQDTMQGAIAAATHDGNQLNLIHVAILEVDDKDSLWVIDVTLTHPVKRDSLGGFLKEFTRRDGTLPEMLVMRLKDPSHAKEHVERVKSFIGQPYDYAFQPDNGAMYCSELVYYSYLKPDGTPIFDCYPMNFKNDDGEFPPYWVRLFERIHTPIPQDVMGTNPQAMYKSEALRPVNHTLVK